jgi:hypothetical protein
MRSLYARSLLVGAVVASSAVASSPPSPRWLPEKRLTSAREPSRTSFNFARSIAAAGGGVSIVWYRDENGVSQVFAKRSADGGATWRPDTRLSGGDKGSEHPAVAVSGRHVYVVWHDFRNGHPDVYLRRSADRGATWGPERLLTPGARDGAHPSLAASGTHVRVVWGSRRTGAGEVYTRGSADRGATWSAERRISTIPSESWVATVELEGRNAYVGWVDYRDANEEEYLRRSTDGGVTWGPAIRMTTDGADSWAPSIAVSGRDVYFCWFDRRDAGVTDAAVERTLDDATALVGLEVDPAPRRDPGVYYLPRFTARLQEKRRAIEAAAPAWIRSGGDAGRLESTLRTFERRLRQWTFGWEIYYRRSTDGGGTWGPATRLTRTPGLSMRPSVAVSGRNVHVVWFEGLGGTTQAYYRHSSTAGAAWDPARRLSAEASNTLSDSVHPSVAAAGRSVYVAWYGGGDGPTQIYFRRAPN